MNGLLGYETLLSDIVFPGYGYRRRIYHNPGGKGNATIYTQQNHDGTILVKIVEDDGCICNGIAYGNYKIINGKIYVNDVKNGVMSDKYRDSFCITPDMYAHLID